MGIAFHKMNGLGNEIVMLDLRGHPGVQITPARARAIAALEGAFFDQLMVLLPPKTEGTTAFVDIWNNDGSRSVACGNGMRCIAAMELDRLGAERTLFETGAGLLETARVGTSDITVDMGPPAFDWQSIPLARDAGDPMAIDLAYEGHGVTLANPATVSMGNPHAIFFVDAADAFPLPLVGADLEHHALFPERANISLAELKGADHIRLKVWERGAGETRACGSAACAVAVAAARKGLTGRTVRVSLPGGDLTLTWAENDHVWMTGAWEHEHEGVLPDAIFAESDAA